MAINHILDSVAGIIRTRWEGKVTIQDIRQYWNERLEEVKHKNLRRAFLDVRTCEACFSGSDLERLLHAAPIAVQFLSGRKVAVLVNGPAQFGTARLLRVYFEDFGISNVFTTETEALAWLLA